MTTPAQSAPAATSPAATYEQWRETERWYQRTKDDSDGATHRLMNIAAAAAWDAVNKQIATLRTSRDDLQNSLEDAFYALGRAGGDTLDSPLHADWIAAHDAIDKACAANWGAA